MTNLTIQFSLYALVVCLFLSVQISAIQIDNASPAGSGTFGSTDTLLPNGKMVVTDPNYSISGTAAIGAVYLFDGATLTLISTLTGGALIDRVGYGGMTVLTSGNLVVSGPVWDKPSSSPIADVGAVTWCNATMGCNGMVTASNSLVGGTADDQVSKIDDSCGIKALSYGNHVVSRPFWDNLSALILAAGATTFGNGAMGTVANGAYHRQYPQGLRRGG